MSYPLISQVEWAFGKYDSYILHPNGSLVGTVHPSGYAYKVNNKPDPTQNNNILFISSRNQQCSGFWFVCASLPKPYKSMKTSVLFAAELILLMGVRYVTTTLYRPDKILLLLNKERPITDGYYRSF